jgi:threonine synthase
MDILVSSNLERLLYHLTGENDKQINEWFTSLVSEGKYEVTDDVKNVLQKEFYAGYSDDEQTKDTIKSIYEQYSYTCDTHTAVAVKVYNEYKAKTGDTTKTIIASTASPYKFSASVLEAIDEGNKITDEYEMIERLNELAKFEIPESLAELKDKEIRFIDSVEKKDMKEYVLKKLGI